MTLFVSTRRLRQELERVDGALRDEPSPEEVGGGEKEAFEAGKRDAPAGDDGASTGEHQFNPSQASSIVFEVPPNIVDGDVANALGDLEEKVEALIKVRGIDALGWYVSFHQRKRQHGIYLDVSRVAVLAKNHLTGTGLGLAERLEIALEAVLQHELFHFAVDCMAANFELASGSACYWDVKERFRNKAGYFELEEQQANAFMLRSIQVIGNKPLRRKIIADLETFCAKQPEGYSVGPYYARSRSLFLEECRWLASHFWVANPDYDKTISQSGLQSSYAAALDTLLFYPSVVRIDRRHCPIFILDEAGLLSKLGVNLDYFGAITNIIETKTFRKALQKLDQRVVTLWERRKSALGSDASLQSLDVKRWRPGGDGCFSVRVDGNYRVHLMRDRLADTWTAIKIGNHKEMGHG